MAATHVLGSEDAVETSVKYTYGGKESCVIEVEGPYDVVSEASAANYCPDDYEVESSAVMSTGDGMGKLVVNGVHYDDSSSQTSIRDTFRVDMLEVQYDLEDHPYLAGVRDKILKWLSTDPGKRIEAGDTPTYKYEDESGQLHEITDATAKKFCAANSAGITTFNRYYPVIEKISLWKNPPGLTRGTGGSFSGGEPEFSDDVGTYATPPITLSGFDAENWFKSKDSWTENADKTWQRVEQWTYTPEASNGDHAWIYKELS